MRSPLSRGCVVESCSASYWILGFLYEFMCSHLGRNGQQISASRPRVSYPLPAVCIGPEGRHWPGLTEAVQGLPVTVIWGLSSALAQPLDSTAHSATPRVSGADLAGKIETAS